jgi:membrane-bound lytic murein transglycosylase B
MPETGLTPSESSLRGKIAANESWARTVDRSARTANARKAMLDKFEQQVDPDGKLTPAERAKRAEHKRRAHFQRMALKSAQVRRRRGGDSA